MTGADLVVAGAGMAGLVAAVQARERGARVAVHEKGDRPGGSMRLSSGVVWRYRDLETFRAECPGGDAALQRLVHERLDGDLRWLEGLGARVVARETGNPRTRGLRFDPASLTEALAARAGPDIRFEQPLRELPPGPVVLATGGFHASRALLREHVTPEAPHLLVRGNRWSTGDGLRLGVAAGASLGPGLGEIYGRAMPAPPATVPERAFVPLAQLYARHGRVESLAGRTFTTRTWSEIDVVQWLARQPDARGRIVVPTAALAEPAADGTVEETIARAEAVGGRVERTGETVAVDVVAGVTTTLGGLCADPAGRVAPGVFAAGQDVGGIATGGYASGLAAALVLGRVAADAALGVG